MIGLIIYLTIGLLISRICKKKLMELIENGEEVDIDDYSDTEYVVIDLAPKTTNGKFNVIQLMYVLIWVFMLPYHYFKHFRYMNEDETID